MRTPKEYYQWLDSLISEKAKLCNPIIIFGVGRGSWYIMKVLEHYGIPISGFADNNSDRHGCYCKYNVYSVEDALEIFPNADIILGVFNNNTAGKITRQLQEFKPENIYYCLDLFIFVYMTEIAQRKCDLNTFAKSIQIMLENYSEGAEHYGFTKNGSFVSPFVTGVITQKCSLQCRDCGQLIPYYKRAKNFSVETIVEDIQNYASAFDVVPEISLHGGEPFLHPQLEKICEQISSISNIVFINLITNGTILPSYDRMQRLGVSGVDIHQSDYGKLSRYQKEIFKICDKNHIYCDIHFVNPTEKWSKTPPMIKHNRTFEENSAIYSKCVSTKICCQIMNGELHRCPLSMHATHQNIIPKFEKDYIALNNQNIVKEKLKLEIRNFLTRNYPLSACDYCDPLNSKEVAPAIQLKKN